MKEYESPNAEMITFVDEKIMTDSGDCNCHYDITSNTMMINGIKPECPEGGETGGAIENPFGVPAPNWNF